MGRNVRAPASCNRPLATANANGDISAGVASQPEPLQRALAVGSQLLLSSAGASDDWGYFPGPGPVVDRRCLQMTGAAALSAAASAHGATVPRPAQAGALRHDRREPADGT